jgi:Inner membrane protein YgaP-like, transmembrane domain
MNSKEEIQMTMNRYIRVFAGSFVLISLALAHWVSPYWLWFTAFVGANLLQSGLTRWCLLEDILAKLGVATKESSGSCNCS